MPARTDFMANLLKREDAQSLYSFTIYCRYLMSEGRAGYDAHVEGQCEIH